jgi:hypothetical protein
MSQDDRRRRVPTSEELERQGALSPAADSSAQGRPGRLRRFFRASRFRVSEDVAARKHIGAPQALGTVVEPKEEPLNLPAPAPSGLSPRNAVPAAQQPADRIARRTIRIDPSVKERRGLGRSGDGGRPGA